MVGLTDKVVSPEWQDFTGASRTNFPLTVTSSPRVNEWSFHCPAETISWQTSMEAMPASTKQWTWPEHASTGLAWKQMWWTTSSGASHALSAATYQLRCWNPMRSPPGPWVKIGVDFFQDHLGKKHLIVADYFSKFPYVFPVASTHHFKTITHLREFFAAEGIPAVVMSDNGPPFNKEEFRQFAHDFDFVHTTSSPHFHQSNGFIVAMVKKVKNAYKKMDGSLNAQARALLQLCNTPIMADLPSPAEILHGHPAQEAVLSRPSKRVNICQIRQRLIKLQDKQKEHFDKAHRAKDLCILKVKEQVQFFHNKQGTGPIKWMTGTVTEILECGQSYMIQAPTAESTEGTDFTWSPYVTTAPPFKTIKQKKVRNSPKTFPFKTISPARPNPCLSRRKPAICTPGPCCLMNPTHIKHPQHHPPCHPQGATHLDHHHAHP